MNDLYELNNFFEKDFSGISQLLGLGKPIKVKFNTGNTKDIMPACWQIWEQDSGDTTEEKVKKGYKAICRTVGIDEKDVKVTEENYGICVQGETMVDGCKYSQYIELPISKEIMSNIKTIKYKCKNGLTFIYLEVVNPERKSIRIEKI